MGSNRRVLRYALCVSLAAVVGTSGCPSSTPRTPEEVSPEVDGQQLSDAGVDVSEPDEQTPPIMDIPTTDGETPNDIDASLELPSDKGPTSDTATDTPPEEDVALDTATDGLDATSDGLSASDIDASDSATDALSPICLTPGDPCVPPFALLCHEGRCNDDLACENTPIEGCCFWDKDCDQSLSEGCLEMRCIQQNCTLLTIPGCCDETVACAPTSSECQQAACVAGRCQRCTADTEGGSDCTCPANPVVTSQDFSAATLLGETGFYATDFNGADSVAWGVDTSRGARAPGALYLGDPLCRTYFNGALGPDCTPLYADGSDATAVRAVLYTPSINLAAGLPSSGAGRVALFSLWADVEDQSGPADALTLMVDDLSGTYVSWPVATSASFGKDTDGLWRVIAVDLSPFEGKFVRIRLDFDTVDGIDNQHEGLYIDDWQVVDRCAGGGCCTMDSDCVATSTDPCLAARCITMVDGGGSVCATVAAQPGKNCQGCSSDIECEDGNPCTADACNDQGICNNDVFCCFEAVAFSASFEEPELAGWTIEDTQPSDNVTWQITTGDAYTQTGSLWCGDATSGTYAANNPVTASIRTPAFELPKLLAASDVITADFWLKLDTEWSGNTYNNPLGLDRLSAHVVTTAGSIEVWSSDDIQGTTGGLWVPVSFDLTLWAASAIQLEFTFDTVDEGNNGFSGPFIDDLRVGTNCP